MTGKHNPRLSDLLGVSVVSLADNTFLRCPAHPARCLWVERSHTMKGDPYKRVEVMELGRGPAEALFELLNDPGTVVGELAGIGPELILRLEDGRFLRCPSEPRPDFWVRIVDANMGEQIRLDADEFSDDPEFWLGALMGALRSDSDELRANVDA